MTSKLHASFRRGFARLPNQIKDRARTAYRLFRSDPFHPSLEFKPLHTRQPVWSVRITDSYRAVGIRNRDTITWFFIGTHGEYDNLLKRQ